MRQQYQQPEREPPEEVKRCPRCEEWKPRSLFGKARHRLDGLHSYCRECKNEGHLSHYHLAHPGARYNLTARSRGYLREIIRDITNTDGEA